MSDEHLVQVEECHKLFLELAEGRDRSASRRHELGDDDDVGHGKLRIQSLETRDEARRQF